MAVTAHERKLLIGGEWDDTGDWIDIASPYSGETVRRVAKAGPDEARRAMTEHLLDARTVLLTAAETGVDLDLDGRITPIKRSTAFQKQNRGSPR